ncbi:Partitioning defective 3 like, partial [Dissostichus eleginoides]
MRHLSSRDRFGKQRPGDKMERKGSSKSKAEDMQASEDETQRMRLEQERGADLLMVLLDQVVNRSRIRLPSNPPLLALCPLVFVDIMTSRRIRRGIGFAVRTSSLKDKPHLILPAAKTILLAGVRALLAEGPTHFPQCTLETGGPGCPSRSVPFEELPNACQAEQQNQHRHTAGMRYV